MPPSLRSLLSLRPFESLPQVGFHVLLPFFIFWHDILEGPWGTVIRNVIIPRLRILELHLLPVSWVNGLLWLPSETALEGCEYLQLADLSAADATFSNIKKKWVISSTICPILTIYISTFILPDRSLIPWSIIPPPTLPSLPSASPYIVDAVTVTAPWVSERTPIPVGKANRNEWTEVERQKAENRVVAADLDDLQKLVRD